MPSAINYFRQTCFSHKSSPIQLLQPPTSPSYKIPVSSTEPIPIAAQDLPAIRFPEIAKEAHSTPPVYNELITRDLCFPLKPHQSILQLYSPRDPLPPFGLAPEAGDEDARAQNDHKESDVAADVAQSVRDLLYLAVHTELHIQRPGQPTQQDE
ncbi:hypothetical protein PoB_001028700 [Plakobranchus ocellatus]|uniref:Uncharacterized protein n=1 Tax=Plakobranchus ocellatus TaxID=259542 RepID=A0AAV3YNR9_9GAST|nr:hypothetical protein PoB_001028700 [Plakobranchus ocellatus]